MAPGRAPKKNAKQKAAIVEGDSDVVADTAPPKKKQSKGRNLLMRTLTFLIVCPIVIGGCTSQFAITLVGIFVGVGTLYEWLVLTPRFTPDLVYPPWAMYVTLAGGFGVVLSNLLPYGRYGFVFALTLSILTTFIFHLALFERYKLKGVQAHMSFQRMAMDVLGLLYCTTLISHGTWYHDHFTHHKGGYTILATFTSWAVDGGGMLFGGNLLGCFKQRHPLIQHVSPNKTVEGVVGGLLCAFVWIGVLKAVDENVLQTFPVPLSVYDWIVLAIIITVATTIGDLCESYLKRSLGVKDSGVFFPGHGGFLDKLDGLYFVLPSVYYYVTTVMDLPADVRP